MEAKKDTVALQTAEQPTTIIRLQVSPGDLITRHKELTELIDKALVRDTDYGIIKGTKNPTLLKPGAERIAVAFGVSIAYEVTEREIDHDRKVSWKKREKKWRNQHDGDREFTWLEVSGESLGLYRYVVRCDLVSRQTGMSVGNGMGCCSTMESKYIDRPRELENTVLKMASKRALVAAVLNTFGLSDRFTQDMEDMPDHGKEAPADTPPKSPPAKLTAAQKKADAEAVGFKATNDRIYNKIQEKKIPTEVVGGWKEQLRIREFPTDYTPGRLAELEALVDGYREPGDDAGEDVAY